MIDKDRFHELYQCCFDENDCIKACGRNACKELISFLGSEYGNIDTGMMNVQKIVTLYHDIMDDSHV